jgi:mannuronan synthase
MKNESIAVIAPENSEAGEMPDDPRQARFDTGTEHPITNIPFTATIDGRQFNGSSISLLSATVSGLAGSEIDGAERIAVLRFSFESYVISVPVTARISRTHAATGALRLDFVEPAGEHLPTLRYLLNSYVAGDVVSLGGIIGAREKVSGASRPKAAAQRTLAQRLAFHCKLAATCLASAALLTLTGKLAIDRFLTSDVTQLASISHGGEPLRAIASGQLAYLNPSAAKGGVVYAIRAASGDTLNVVMPCDCKAEAANIFEGSTVLSGDTVVELLRTEAAPSVEVIVDSNQAKGLIAGDVAELTFTGGTTQFTQLKNGPDALQPLAGTDKMRAVFSLDSPVPDVAKGGPVSVRIIDARIHALNLRFRSLFASQ